MGDIARLRTESAWPARRGCLGTEAVGRLQGTLVGVTAERPALADPRALPSRASPARRWALSRRKQRLIRYPRPASQRRGNGRVAEGNLGGQRSGGARTASEDGMALPSPVTRRRHFEKSPRAIFQAGGKGQGIRIFPSCQTARSLCCFFPSPVVQAKLKFQVRLIQLHPSGLTARLVPAAAFHLPGLLGRRVGL